MAQDGESSGETFRKIFEDELRADLEALREDLNRQGHGGYLPPKQSRSRWQRFRGKLWWKQYYTRQKIAQRIAPWLHDD